jgi:hypothetical protein
MIQPGTSAKRRELELAAIRILCQGTAGRPLLREGLRVLGGYRLTDPLLQVVFEALKEMPSEEPSYILERLPARLMNLGFPDVALESFYQPHSFTREEALELLRRLSSVV